MNELGRLRRRLDYAVLQLAREAKFIPQSNGRFWRAFDCVVDVRDGLVEMERMENMERLEMERGDGEHGEDRRDG